MADKLGGEKLGDLLVKAGLIDSLQLQAALGHQRRWGSKIGKCLVDLGLLDESELLQFLSDHFKIKAVDLAKSVISEQVFAAVPEAIAKKYGVTPVFLKEGPGSKKTIILAMSDPSDLKVVDEVQFLTGYRVEPVLATESAIGKVMEHYGRSYQPEVSSDERKREVRPVDLRKDHQAEDKKQAAAQNLESVELGDAELMLGGEEVEEILDLKEAEQEGIEISSDDEIRVVKGEVVMVRSDRPKPKGAKGGSSAERIPVRTRIREEFKTAPPPQVEPPPRPAPAEPAPEFSLAPPDIDLGTAGPEHIIKNPEAPPKPQTPIEIPESVAGEKMEVVQAHEFVNWNAAAPAPSEPEGEDIFTQKEKLEPVTLKTPSAEIKLNKPESADEDFWQETEAPVGKLEAKPAMPEPDEERLPFEMPLEPPAPPPKKQEFLGNLEDVTMDDQGETESELYSGEAARDLPAAAKAEAVAGLGEETGEMSLEFAVKTIRELKDELKQREFQMDELLNLMMKKEIGEITTEIYMKELGFLKNQVDQIKAKKG